MVSAALAEKGRRRCFSPCRPSEIHDLLAKIKQKGYLVA